MLRGVGDCVRFGGLRLGRLFYDDDDGFKYDYDYLKACDYYGDCDYVRECDYYDDYGK